LNSTSFHIYNASAGSGKTYALVKDYLKVLFKSNAFAPYKHILGITFTNKAAGEMKARIIKALREFASQSNLDDPSDMFKDLHKELDLSPEALQKKSQSILNSIVHNYAAFDISTIDRFTQKLIRAFALDLSLSMNFEVELDTETLLNEAVDRLISKAGSHPELTKILVDFAIEKADDDKSWDISLDFYKIAKLLVRENDIPFLEGLKTKTLEDFKGLNRLLKERIKASEQSVTSDARRALVLISECGLEFTDFSRSSLPKHFEKLQAKRFDTGFDLNWQQDLMNGKPLYPGRISPDISAIIDEIQPQLSLLFTNTKTHVFRIKFLRNIYKNGTLLSLLNSILAELQAIKEERNIILISEFNSIVGREIQGQPAPFIYERIGERFHHYFIDEFQDTSVLQWQNLIPLLDNSLSAENGSALLVGDAKQAIYRWRGGNPEQFIGLCNDDNPFQIEKKVLSLPRNFRSHKAIIGFNNSFFSHLSSFAFRKEPHAALYRQSPQKGTKNEEGYVSLNFLNLIVGDDRDELFPEKVFEIISKCLDKGFRLKDLCILVRKKKEGIAIADYLNNKGIDIVSSETLLVTRSPQVRFVIDLLAYIVEPNNKILKSKVLTYLRENALDISDGHAFYRDFIDVEIDSFFSSLKAFGISFDYRESLQLSLYEIVETILHSFDLAIAHDAYIQFFLDFVLDYSLKQRSSLSDFIVHFNSKKDDLSIISPEEKDAVKIMTIHKSKGLEFPVVIFPYADLDIYKEVEPKVWFPLEASNYKGFTHVLLSYNNDVENFAETGKQIHNDHKAELELDNINLLYVALTRAVEQLHIIGSKQIDNKGNENLRSFSGLFINYLKAMGLWNDQLDLYAFGNPERSSEIEAPVKRSVEQQHYIINPRKNQNLKILTKAGYLWDTKQEQAIEKGNLIHLIMSRIKTKIDIDITLNTFLASGTIHKAQLEELKDIVFSIVDHPELAEYFKSAFNIYNERDIITMDNVLLRPDRLVINDNSEVVIMDYKTGRPENKHMEQLHRYEKSLNDMGYTVIKKILIYINDVIETKIA
jgi:ATP-dependent exoDNAse (exonuclease V) beta subunit